MPKPLPSFLDVVTLLNVLYGDDPDIGSAPHGAFWQNVNRDEFVAMKTDDWGVPGSLVIPGQPENSNLYLALLGAAPFDGSLLPRMPDIDRFGGARYASTDEVSLVEAWIKNGAH
jgi:hypothetical protein